MYTRHFGLSEPPFGITPDTSYFHPYPHDQRALNTLLIALREGEGFIKITGEVGSGKTLLCRKFLGMLDEDFVTAYLPNPMLQPKSMMAALAEELGLPVSREMDEYQILKAINQRLLQIAQEGKRVLLCLDEAQAMPLETLEALRLLTNLETEKRKLLQIVLFGQPELDRKLEEPSIRQLNQRITFRYELGALDLDETRHYLQHRLGVAGCSAEVFQPGAVGALHKASRGLPRLLNILAHKSLMLAYGQGQHTVSARHVRGAVADTPSALATAGQSWTWISASAAALVGLAISLAWMIYR